MTGQKKLSGEERRSQVLQLLKNAVTPITGSELAAKTNVSRQAIVGDINLLKAKNEPIIATSQGYMYLKQAGATPVFEKMMTCRHLPDEVEREFNLIVDHGVTIKEVRIEHSAFGSITASIMISNRIEVKQFIEKLSYTKAFFLSKLTHGFHLLTLSSSCESALNDVENELQKAGFIKKAGTPLGK